MLTKDDFTEREFDVLELLANGLNNKEIAEKLNFSLSTVKTYVQILLRKFCVSNRIQVAIEANLFNIVTYKKNLI